MKLLWHPNKSQLSKSVFKSRYASINFRLQFNGDSGGWGSGSSQFWCASTDSICQIRINCIQVGWHNNIHIYIYIYRYQLYNYIILYIYIIYDATMILIDNIHDAIWQWRHVATFKLLPATSPLRQGTPSFQRGRNPMPHRSGRTSPHSCRRANSLAICQNDRIRFKKLHPYHPYPILVKKIGWKTNVEHIGGFLM